MKLFIPITLIILSNCFSASAQQQKPLKKGSEQEEINVSNHLKRELQLKELNSPAERLDSGVQEKVKPKCIIKKKENKSPLNNQSKTNNKNYKSQKS